MSEYLPNAHGLIAVHVVPKSPANRIEGWEEDAAGERWLKVRITAAPEDGKANAALLKFLARYWKLPASRISVVSGQKSRYKRLQIEPE